MAGSEEAVGEEALFSAKLRGGAGGGVEDIGQVAVPLVRAGTLEKDEGHVFEFAHDKGAGFFSFFCINLGAIDPAEPEILLDRFAIRDVEEVGAVTLPGRQARPYFPFHSPAGARDTEISSADFNFTISRRVSWIVQFSFAARPASSSLF